MRHGLCLTALVSAAAACQEDPAAPHPPMPDAAVSDARSSAPDASPPDALPSDARPPDETPPNTVLTVTPASPMKASSTQKTAGTPGRCKPAPVAAPPSSRPWIR